MSLFTRTVAQVDRLEQSVKHLEANTNDTVATRKESGDAANGLITEISPTVQKLVAKAQAGEGDPNKRTYGASMVTKIFALNDRFQKICTEFTPLYEAVQEEYMAFERERLAEVERKRIEDEEKRRAEEQRLEIERIEKEKIEQAERERLQKEQEEKLRREQEEAAARKAEEAKREAERQKQEAERLAEEKRRKEEEEKAAALKKEQEKATASATRSTSQALGAGGSQPGMITVSIKTARGVTHKLTNIAPTATVADLKIAIEKFGTKRADQRLIFQGRLLVDSNSISSYKIADGSAVHLVEHPSSSPTGASSTAPAVNWIVPPSTLCHLKDGREEYEQILNQCGNRRLVVVDWFAPWCGPCRAIAPAFERLATRFSDVTFIKINTEASGMNSLLASEKRIASYPTFHFILNNELKHSFSGANATALESNIRRYREEALSKAQEAGSSASSAAAGTSIGGPMAQALFAALTTLKQHVSHTEFLAAVRTLLTIVHNITSHPGIEKYRRVRVRNEIFNSRVGSKRGGLDCMYAFGFERVPQNNETYLVMSPATSESSELRTVLGQLDQAIMSGSNNPRRTELGTPNANPATNTAMDILADAAAMDIDTNTARNPTTTPTAPTPAANPTGGLDSTQEEMLRDLAGQMGRTFGGNEAGIRPEGIANLMQDPGFRALGNELAEDPEATTVLLEAQRLLQSGDMAAAERMQSHPAMARLRNRIMDNPGFLSALMTEMGQQGLPGTFGNQERAGGAPGGGAQGGLGQAAAGGGGEGVNTPAAAAAPPYPGAPSTAEEEERLLQEAIRLSMQEQQKQPDDKSGDSNDGQS